MNLRQQYLETAFICIEALNALKYQATYSDNFAYALSCAFTASLLDSAVSTRDLDVINQMLFQAAQVLESGGGLS